MKKYTVLLLSIFLIGCVATVEVGPRGTWKNIPVARTSSGLPSLRGTVFVDAEPFDWPELHGKVILLALLDFTEKEEQEVLPVLNLWRNSASVLNSDFEIIGVHVPKSNIFYSLGALREVMKEYSVEYQVIIDQEQLLWAGFGRYKKPFLVLIDETGQVRKVYHSIVDYTEVIADLEERGIRVTAGGFENNILAGFEKGKVGNAEDIFGFVSHEYTDAGGSYIPGVIYLDGFWINRPTSYYYEEQPGRSDGYLAFRFYSSNVSIIAQRGKIHITIDGLPVPVGYLDEDAKLDNANNTFSEITKRRIYRIVKDLPPKPEGYLMKIYPQRTGFELFQIRFSVRHGWKQK